MKVDIGFWDINGNYIPDIQELNEIERKEIMETKNYDGFFEEVNDMANFKGFGESEGTDEIAELKAENERLKEENYGLNQELLGYKKGVQASEIIELKQTLQEIKAIAETELSYDMVGNEHRHYKNYDIIRHLITKAEEE